MAFGCRRRGVMVYIACRGHKHMPKSLIINDNLSIPASDIRYRFSRSSGPGGQHVNKVETKAEIIFLLGECQLLDEKQKARIRRLAAARLDSDGNLIVSSQADRSRSANLALAEQQLAELIRQGLKEPKVRMATKATRSSKVTRARSKRKLSEKKGTRRKLSTREDFEEDY